MGGKVKKIFRKKDEYTKPAFLLNGEGLPDGNRCMVASTMKWVISKNFKHNENNTKTTQTIVFG